MCSIIGYYGDADAAPALVRGLRRMEYRGYDSVGVATADGGGITVKKGTGRVDEVNSRMGLDSLAGRAGIGHTRWATHGGVTDANAHPHQSSPGGVAIAHNGIIENYEEIKGRLAGLGYRFQSETDSEVIANLLDHHRGGPGGAAGAVRRTVAELRGEYAFVAVFGDGTLAAARFHRSLIIGAADGGLFLSSDVLGFLEYTDEVVYMEDGSYAIVDGDGYRLYDFGGGEAHARATKVSREFGDAYRGDYAHYTIKEIHEQPETVPRAGTPGALEEAAALIRRAPAVHVTGSGSSYNAALVARHVLQSHAGVTASPVISSELRFSPESVGAGSVLVAISQSGESADVLDAVGIAKGRGCRIVALVNVATSPLAREADVTVPMNCGPEIGVAATKSFTAQLAAIYGIAGALAGGPVADLAAAAAAVGGALEGDAAREAAEDLAGVSDVYVLGRGAHYPIALEAALKLKELAYIHAEGIAGGELKHGPLALMDEGAVVIIINPRDSTYRDTQTSAREIRARGARIIGISDAPSDVYDRLIPVPEVPEAAFPLVEMVPVQLLAYHAALGRGADPDHPRNLAKSVTVE